MNEIRLPMLSPNTWPGTRNLRFTAQTYETPLAPFLKMVKCSRLSRPRSWLAVSRGNRSWRS
jgi:hypothetical protein